MEEIKLPLQINLGKGLIIVANFSDENGHGVCFSRAKEPKPIGEVAPIVAGEIFIHCSNVESAMVLKDAVDAMVAKFHDDALIGEIEKIVERNRGQIDPLEQHNG